MRKFIQIRLKFQKQQKNQPLGTRFEKHCRVSIELAFPSKKEFLVLSRNFQPLVMDFKRLSQDRRMQERVTSHVLTAHLTHAFRLIHINHC